MAEKHVKEGDCIMSKNITEIFREIAEKEMPSIVMGVVTEANPIRVVLADDTNIRLSAQSLIVSSDKVPLEVGDEIYMLATNRNKIYYVLDRV